MRKHHCLWFIRVRDSGGNKFIRAEVGGGGDAPFWRLREWWTGGRVYIHTADRQKSVFEFWFPEGTMIDILAHGLANFLNWREQRRTDSRNRKSPV